LEGHDNFKERYHALMTLLRNVTYDFMLTSQASGKQPPKKNVCGRKRRERITEKKERQQLTLTVSGGEKGPWGERMHVFQPDKSGTN